MIRDGLAGNVKGHLINSTAQVDEGLHPYVSLMEALESIFSSMNYESGLLTVECNTVAIFKSDGQEISTKILISWQELKNRFLSFFVHK